MHIFDVQFDGVINGLVAMGHTSYDDAINKLIPLIDKTEFQRKLQDKKFYKKLERDIEDGCVMPAITVAFITDVISKKSAAGEVQEFVAKEIDKSFVLDGIQRLNTLSRLSESRDLDKSMKLYINFIFCDSVEKLLYRMITLNNGQRPMTPRHQVEIMMANTFDFDVLGVRVVSEKEASSKSSRKAFKKADIIQSYLAFMADSPIVDNKKIIEEKMDELLVSKIMAIEPTTYKSNFKDFIRLLAKFQENADAFKWLKVSNNIVGFSAGMKHSVDIISALTADEFCAATKVFDAAFSEFNPSRIKVGKYRRELSCEYFKNFDEYKGMDADELLEVFSELTSND